MRTRATWAVVPALLAAGLLIAACTSSGSPGTGNKTAADLLPRVQAAVKSATSVRMAGNVQDGSQTVTMDMSFYGKSELSGTLSEGTGTITVLSVAGKTYIKVDSAFLKTARLPASVCSAMCGKYVELPGSEASQITGSLSLPALSKQVFGKLPSAKKASGTFVPATFDGKPVLKYQQDGAVLDVAGSGTPYPVRIQGKRSGGGTVTFSEWNAVPAPSAPPAGRVLNISQL